jgi:VIT1/CCC1 family predicted Fe2+/Mn2+ transporter
LLESNVICSDNERFDLDQVGGFLTSSCRQGTSISETETMETTEVEARHSRPTLERYLPDLVYGANDGIVTTLVVIASIAGAAMSSKVFLILGTANLLADGFSMGTSNVLAIRSALTAATRPSLWDASGNGIATFAAFVIAGLLPISAYLFPLADEIRLPAACVLAAAALFGIGACRALFSDRGWLVAGLEMLTLGAIASVVAYAVGAAAAALVGGSV